MNKTYFIAGLLLVSVISCTEKNKPADDAAWRSKGDSLITQTFDTLRNTLLKAIGEKGFPGAVGFCNIEALPLTNSYASEGITIKRSSDKIRNAANTADSLEQRMLRVLRGLKEKNLPLINLVIENKDEYHYFKPILLQAMCLNCHGDKVTQIKPDTWEMIQKKYPADSAFNYKEGDLRGIWHITFKK